MSDRFEISRRINTPTGVRYLAVDLSTGREAHLQRIPPDGSDCVLADEAFDTAAAKLPTISHPQLIQTLALGRDDEGAYAAIALTEGEVLSEFMRRTGTLSVKDLVTVAKDCLAGLSALHDRGLLHGDPMPARIMVQRDEAGRLGAKLSDAVIQQLFYSPLHQPGTALPWRDMAFTAPEIIRQEPSDDRADLYMLGCSLYFALSGKLPFEGPNPDAVAKAQLLKRVKPLSSFGLGAPKFVTDWIASIMSPEVNDRPSSAEDALQQLNASMQHTVVQPKPAASRPRPVVHVPRPRPQPAQSLATPATSVPEEVPAKSRRKWPIVLSICLVLGSAGAVAYWWWHGKTATPVVAAPPPPVVETQRARQTLTLPVVGGANDAEENALGVVNLVSSDLEMAQDASKKDAYQIVAIRFVNIPVSQKDMIKNAYIQFKCDEPLSNPTDLKIHAELSVNSPPLTAAPKNVSERKFTTASANWKPLPWPKQNEAGPAHRTSDLTAILNELIQNPEWKPTNAVTFLIRGIGTRIADSANKKGGTPPALVIDVETEVTLPTSSGQPSGGTGPSTP